MKYEKKINQWFTSLLALTLFLLFFLKKDVYILQRNIKANKKRASILHTQRPDDVT